jgi:sensor histidine kinase regulating citrate/malate metabolism
MIEDRLLVFLTAMLGYIVLVLVVTFLVPKMLDKSIKKDDSSRKWEN